MTAALSEWVKCYWIKFILNCTESKWVASSVTLVCTESQTTHEPLASLSLLWFQEILEIKFGIFFFFFFYEFMAIRQPKHPSPWFWLLEYFRHHTGFSECSRVCSHSCVCMFFHWGLFLRVKVCQILSRIWASEFDTVRACFVFVKIEFCCKMHMREFCTEVTIVP